MSGWFSVKRGITSHPIFRGKPERLAIWLWLLDNACWQDTQHDINGKIVTIPRGSVAASERRIAEEVGVGRQVVRTFLKLIQEQRMINPCSTHGRNVISLCNWDKYQQSQPKPNPAPNPRLTHGQPTKEQVNNSVSKDTGEIAGLIDPIKALFDTTVALLESGGTPAKQARGMVGKWRKEHGDEALIAAVASAKRHGAVEPLQFIQGALKHTAAKAAEPKTGDTKKTPRGDWVRYSEGIGWCPMSASEAAYYGLE